MGNEAWIAVGAVALYNVAKVVLVVLFFVRYRKHLQINFSLDEAFRRLAAQFSGGVDEAHYHGAWAVGACDAGGERPSLFPASEPR